MVLSAFFLRSARTSSAWIYHWGLREWQLICLCGISRSKDCICCCRCGPCYGRGRSHESWLPRRVALVFSLMGCGRTKEWSGCMQDWLSGCVPIGVCYSLGSHDLVDSTIFFPFLDLVLLCFHLLPSFVLSLQHFNPLPFQLRLSTRLIVLSSHLLIRSEIFLKAFQC